MDTKTTVAQADELTGRRVLALLPPAKKDLAKYLAQILEGGKERWGWKVSVVCQEIDRRPLQKLVTPGGQSYLLPHFLRVMKWESDPSEVAATEKSMGEAEVAAGLPVGRITLASAHSVGRAFSAPFRIPNSFPLLKRMLKDNMEPFRVLRRFFRAANEILDQADPDFIYAFQWATPFNFIVWLAATRRGIPCLTLRPSKIRSDYAFWTTDRLLFNVNALEEAEIKRRQGAPVSQAAIDKIDKFRNQPSMVKYIAAKWSNRTRRGFWRWHLEYIRIVTRELASSLRGQDRSMRESGFARFYRFYRRLFLSYYHERFFNAPDADVLEKMKYVYFPMHKEAELAQTFQATLWHDQRHTIRALAAMLPFGYRLLVREHRMNYGSRPTRAYRETQQIPNVIMIDPFDSQFKYLRNADLVVTENGSSGWESMLLGRRTLLVSKTFYQGAGLGVSIDDPDQLNTAMLDMLAKPAVTDQKAYDHALGCMIDAEFENTFPMNKAGVSDGLDLLPKTLAGKLRARAKTERPERVVKTDADARSVAVH